MAIQSVGGTPLLPPAQARVAEAVSEPVTGISSGGDERDVPGVIRNLQDGKYKGVADVRLRIVHADKLAVLQADAIRAELSNSASSLTDSLRPVLDDFVASQTPLIEGEVLEGESGLEQDEPTDAAAGAEAEASSVAGALEQFTASIAATAAAVEDVAGFATAARDAFAALVESLNLQSTETVSEATDGEGDPALSVAEAPRDYLAELAAAFEASLQSLLESATAASALPPLSEPNGNGVAYEKFLAMYREIQGGETQADATLETPAALDAAV